MSARNPSPATDPHAAVRIVPHYCARTWQSCDYWRGATHLFHEREGIRTAPPTRNGVQSLAGLLWLASGKPWLSQWFPGAMTESEAREVAKRHGLGVMREPYAEESEFRAWFLTCDDTERALAFTLTDDFARHCTGRDGAKVGNGRAAA